RIPQIAINATKPKIVAFLCLSHHENILNMYFLKNLEMKFSFSTIFLRSNTLHITGTYVILNISDPKSAYPKVKASGENIFPSTFWKEKIGIKATIRMICAKTIYPATLPALFL